nr:microbial terpene synthase-like protein 7 [Dryopteris fragrans]
MIRTPRIQCSFACNNHPDSERLKKESHAWIVARFALLPSARGSFTVDKLTQSCFELFATLTFASGKPCRMMPILKYVAWFFLFDTVLDDPLLVGADPSATDALCSVICCLLDDSSSSIFFSDDPFIRVLTDTMREWWVEICLVMPSVLQARFRTSFKEYLEASRRQIQYRASGCLPDLDTFLPLRVYAGGAYTCFHLIQYTLDICFDEETVAHPLFVAVNAAAIDHLNWVNDLLSFKKELMEGDLLGVDGKEKEVALQDVVDEVCGMLRERDEECVRLMAEIKASPLLMSKAGMAGYLQGLGNWMRGNVEWHM